jgi:hypothetical protein
MATELHRDAVFLLGEVVTLADIVGWRTLLPQVMMAVT